MKTTIPILLVVLVACAPDLEFGDDSRYVDASVPDVEADGGVVPVGGPHVVHTVEGHGYRAAVNAQDYVAWVYVDLDTGLEVIPVDAANDNAWDVAFRRSNIAVNGGVTGSGDVEVAVLATPFDDVTSAPAGGYVTDVADGDDDDTLPDYVFRAWYDYDTTTHVLTPADHTYVVHTTAGAFVKLRMTAYYDAVGTSGSPSFRWVALP